MEVLMSLSWDQIVCIFAGSWVFVDILFWILKIHPSELPHSEESMQLVEGEKKVTMENENKRIKSMLQDLHLIRIVAYFSLWIALIIPS